ncbi:MAG: hypothetical protein JWP81_1518 [Ferruginibacter sp.]|nr:hypothetical protein [Ferruginibacter sp.]
MKKILPIIIASLLCLQSYGQLMQASIGIGSQANRIKIYLKSSVTQAPSSISTLQFNVGINATGIVVSPNLAVLSSAFPSVTWAVEKHLDGGYWNYNITTATSPLTPSFTANTEFEAMELEFSNGTPNMANVGLVTLPDGGALPSNSIFLCTGTVSSNGMSNLYYARTGVTVNNQNSYDLVASTPGTATSTAFISSVVLPVKFLGFNVIKKNNDAILNWQIENETSITDRYEVERSLNGVDFKNVNTITPKHNGLSSNSYDLADVNLNELRSAGIFYYRIKQYDKDGHFIYSETKSVRLTSKGIVMGVYPNPLKDFANLSIDLEQNANATITVTDASGKQVQYIQTLLFKGPNIKKINMSAAAAGSYLLKLQTATETKTMSIVKTL